MFLWAPLNPALDSSRCLLSLRALKAGAANLIQVGGLMNSLADQ